MGRDEGLRSGGATVVAMDSEVAVVMNSRRENSAEVGIDSDRLSATDSVVTAAMDSDRAAAAVSD